MNVSSADHEIETMLTAYLEQTRALLDGLCKSIASEDRSFERHGHRALLIAAQRRKIPNAGTFNTDRDDEVHYRQHGGTIDFDCACGEFSAMWGEFATRDTPVLAVGVEKLTRYVQRAKPSLGVEDVGASVLRLAAAGLIEKNNWPFGGPFGGLFAPALDPESPPGSTS